MSPFDGITFDPQSKIVHGEIKDHFDTVFSFLKRMQKSHAQNTALEKMQESFMWIGKALAFDQTNRTSKKESNRERTKR